MSIRIALAGNPNSGKTTLYNALTGKSEKVGNWAGVTVDKKELSSPSSHLTSLIIYSTPTSTWFKFIITSYNFG